MGSKWSKSSSRRKIKIDKDTKIKALWKKIQVKVSYDAGGGSGEMTGATQDKGSEYTVLPNTFTAPDDTQEFDTWEVNGQKVAPGSKIKIDKDTKIKALWKKKDNSKPGEGGTKPDPVDPTPGNPENPAEPDETPGNETENPDQPGDETPANPDGDNQDQPNTPDKPTNPDQPKTPEKPGDKKVEKGGKEVVVSKEVRDKYKGKLSPEDRTKIEEKLKERNPDIVDVKVDEKGNAHITFSDGKKETLTAKDLSDAAGIKIPKKHSEDSLSKKAGKNVKTGIGSIAGVICTLVGSTGALYIGRKKED